MVRTFVMQAGRPGWSMVLSTCFEERCECSTRVLLTCPRSAAGLCNTGCRLSHVLPCLCDNACKRSPATCQKSIVFCASSNLQSLHVLNWDINMLNQI